MKHQQGMQAEFQQNPPILNWRCRLTQDVLYNGCKTIVVRVIAVAVVVTDETICIVKTTSKTPDRYCTKYTQADLTAIFQANRS